MNLPNKLTMLRVCLVPVFLVFILVDKIPFNYSISLVIFVAASLTDALDGHIARKNHLVTNFGKFLDPLADKVLVITALAVFVEFGVMSCVPFVIIIAREFMVSGLRLTAADSGVVVPAGFLGKLKTAFTMAAIVFILLCFAVSEDFGWFNISAASVVESAAYIISQILIWIAAALTVVSGVVYLKGYWKLIDTDK